MSKILKISLLVGGAAAIGIGLYFYWDKLFGVSDTNDPAIHPPATGAAGSYFVGNDGRVIYGGYGVSDTTEGGRMLYDAGMTGKIPTSLTDSQKTEIIASMEKYAPTGESGLNAAQKKLITMATAGI